MLPPSTCLCFPFPASGVGSLSVAARCFPLTAPAAFHPSECCQSFLLFSSFLSHHPYRPDNPYSLSPPFTASSPYLPYSSYLHYHTFLCIPFSSLSFLSSLLFLSFHHSPSMQQGAGWRLAVRCPFLVFCLGALGWLVNFQRPHPSSCHKTRWRVKEFFPCVTTQRLIDVWTDMQTKKK